ncbi:MAG: amidohydrolase family protein, partial [Prolixibacteraceae bacterium]|nr:amidohydrolase family protein [Prolixibacteraceae bacterium]
RNLSTGLPNGIIRRSAFRLVKLPESPSYTEQEKTDALVNMFARYNRYGITGVCSGSGNFSMFEKYNRMKEEGVLTVRVFVNIPLSMNTERTAEEWTDYISGLNYKTGDGDEWVRVGALKVSLDGGILTGTALMREPWGEIAQEIFGIEDAGYKGVQNYTYEQLLPAVRAAIKNGWKFTAHSTGGGGVDLLLNVYEEVNKHVPVKDNRCSVIHGNFFTPASIEKMKRLGVYADIQPAWFYKDADAMKYILGDERIKTFLPYRSLLEAGIVMNGGSDHMVKFDANQSINPYNPFLGIWNMVTRTTERGNTIIPDEAISREDALRAYTINNAFASFEENIRGSLEVGKLADLAILTDDILTCPADRIKNIEADLTMVDGKIVYSSGKIVIPSF